MLWCFALHFFDRLASKDIMSRLCLAFRNRRMLISCDIWFLDVRDDDRSPTTWLSADSCNRDVRFRRRNDSYIGVL